MIEGAEEALGLIVSKAKYKDSIALAKTLAPTMFQTVPARTAATIRIGVAAIASASPMPWLMVFAISSPVVGTHSSVAPGFISVQFYTMFRYGVVGRRGW